MGPLGFPRFLLWKCAKRKYHYTRKKDWKTVVVLWKPDSQRKHLAQAAKEKGNHSSMETHRCPLTTRLYKEVEQIFYETEGEYFIRGAAKFRFCCAFGSADIQPSSPGATRLMLRSTTWEKGPVADVGTKQDKPTSAQRVMFLYRKQRL